MQSQKKSWGRNGAFFLDHIAVDRYHNGDIVVTAKGRKGATNAVLRLERYQACNLLQALEAAFLKGE